jgi:hypothetical protein
MTRRLPYYIVGLFVSYYAFMSQGLSESEVYLYLTKGLYTLYDLR